MPRLGQSADQTRADRPSDALHRTAVLVVEPDHLTRWSILAYLQARCSVSGVTTVRAGRRVLETEALDMLVLSDQLPARSAEQFVRRARGRNPALIVVQLVSDLTTSLAAPGIILLEKPFALARLAELVPPDPQAAH